MSDVQFEGEKYFSSQPSRVQKQQFSTKLVSWGIAKNEQQANYILVGAAVAVLLIAAFIFFRGGATSLNQNPELVPEIAVPTGP